MFGATHLYLARDGCYFTGGVRVCSQTTITAILPVYKQRGPWRPFSGSCMAGGEGDEEEILLVQAKMRS